MLVLSDIDDKRLLEALQRYLGEILHEHVVISPINVPGVPSFISGIYSLFQAQIVGRKCIVMARNGEDATPSDIAKHIAAVRNITREVVLFATMTLSAHNRARLVSHGVPFIVPGNQFYAPDFAIDFREHFRTHWDRQTEGLSPAAQAVLFHHLLQTVPVIDQPTTLAARLLYSPMSVGRAFDDLVAAGLAETTRVGRDRRIKFKTYGRQLFEEALPLLRTPARTTKFVRGNPHAAQWKIGGESALSLLTDLSSPRLETFVIASNNWKAISKSSDISQTSRDGADFAIETWSYDPNGLSSAETVDPLSLHVQFREHGDERIAMAANQLLENMPW
ncbi:DNA-binding MarR family transcriptional regulator [Nitrobacteraceae bacterium AZCC 2161]